MFPLLGFSILAVALSLERLFFWLQVVNRQDRLVREVFNLYPRSPRNAFQKLEQNADLPIARIFLAALELDRPNPEEFRLALESAAQAEIPVLKRFNTVFETIISLSPLLGLLGTILGLIRSFASLRIGDIAGSNSAGVSGGISEALVSTAAGLIVDYAHVSQYLSWLISATNCVDSRVWWADGVTVSSLSRTLGGETLCAYLKNPTFRHRSTSCR